MEVRDSRELDVALEVMIREHPEALLLLVDPFTLSQRSRIVEFAAEQRLPAIYETRDFVDVGGLISYGPNIAVFCPPTPSEQKILRGGGPAVLPPQDPNKFQFGIKNKMGGRGSLLSPSVVLPPRPEGRGNGGRGPQTTKKGCYRAQRARAGVGVFGWVGGGFLGGGGQKLSKFIRFGECGFLVSVGWVSCLQANRTVAADKSNPYCATPTIDG